MTALFAVSAGAVVGVAASVYHSAWFPWGLVIIMVALGASLVGLRVFFRPRYPTVAASIGLIVALTALAGSDGHGSVLIAGNAAGLSLLAGVAFLLIVANAWPSGVAQSRVKLGGRTGERTKTQ